MELPPSMRLTRQRQTIRELVDRATDHPTAAQIYDRARVLAPGIGQATVYRTLAALVAAGEIREVRVGDVVQYDRRMERHDHMICRRCGALVDIVVPFELESLLEAAGRAGFAVEGYQIEVSGLCSACR